MKSSLKLTFVIFFNVIIIIIVSIFTIIIFGIHFFSTTRWEYNVIKIFLSFSIFFDKYLSSSSVFSLLFTYQKKKEKKERERENVCVCVSTLDSWEERTTTTKSKEEKKTKKKREKENVHGIRETMEEEKTNQTDIIHTVLPVWISFFIWISDFLYVKRKSKARHKQQRNTHKTKSKNKEKERHKKNRKQPSTCAFCFRYISICIFEVLSLYHTQASFSSRAEK